MQRSQRGFGYGLAVKDDPAWRLIDVLAATGGACATPDADRVFRSVVTDSRGVEAGDLFVALTGDRFDGHDFVADAVRRGAAGVVVARPPATPLPVCVVQVADTLTALGDLAAYRRRRIAGLRVAAITGSCGKTTVKEMVAAILGQRHRLVKTHGNYNNLVGLPLSLLPVCHHHRFAVLEMGMNRPGEIARLTAIADPNVACITNVMEAHIGAFADLRAVAAAKEELFAGVGADAVLVVNLDDPLVRAMVGRYPNPVVTFGRRSGAVVRGLRPRQVGDAAMSFTLEIEGRRRRVRLGVFGAHLLVDALAAAAICHGLGEDIDAIAAGLELFQPPAMRMRIIDLGDGVHVVDDTYNANPGSMRAALETVAFLRRSGRLIAVLGDMFELGAQSENLHRQLGTLAARVGCDRLLAVGGFADTVAAAARSAGLAEVHSSPDRQAAATLVKELAAAGEIGAGDWILVKGSRGMRMETVVDALTAAFGGGEGR